MFLSTLWAGDSGIPHLKENEVSSKCTTMGTLPFSPLIQTNYFLNPFLWSYGGKTNMNEQIAYLSIH